MGRTARVALLQLRAYSVEQAEASLAHTLGRIDEAARERPDVVVLPEGTYPAYFIGPEGMRRPGVLPPSEALARFAAKAREHGVHVATGLALDDGAGGHVNGAALIGRDGELIGTYAKSFLWHFDRKWFTPGSAYPVFETDFGRVGMLVCADGRLPEIARSLAVGGAQIIVDMTAWVSGGRSAAELTSSQREYLMPCRAAENGVWVVAADKCGVEAESIVYCGRSCVIDPHGRYVASLGPDEEETLVYDVRIEDGAAPIGRRPALYEALTQPTESLPVVRTLEEAMVPREEEHHVAAVQMAMPPDGRAFVEAAGRHIERLAAQDAELVLFPATPSRLRNTYRHDEVLAGVSEIAVAAGVCIAFTVWHPDADGRRRLYLVGPRGVIASHEQTHKPLGARFEAMPLGDAGSPVANTPVGRVGLLLAAEGFVPEVARSLMLRGAEVLLWASDDPMLPMLPFARTRADENRAFVVSAGAPTTNGATAIVEPSGRVLAVALEGRELAVGAAVNRTLSHVKTRAPGTDVVRDRQPATYGALVRRTSAPEPVL